MIKDLVSASVSSPRAILLDMDDTIISDGGLSDKIWNTVCAKYASYISQYSPEEIHAAIIRTSNAFWSDTENHRRGRLDLNATRKNIVRQTFNSLGLHNDRLADDIADAFSVEKDRAIAPFPGALETVKKLKEHGLSLALITNGASDMQRRKIERFGLALYFDCILIEGEFGTGKPDARVFQAALDNLKVQASEAWMVGDDLERDIAGAQKLGIKGIWVDWRGSGVSPDSPIQPDRIISAISQLS